MTPDTIVQNKTLLPQGCEYDLTTLLYTYLAEYVEKQNGTKEQHDVVVELYGMMSPEQKKLIKDMTRFVTRPSALPAMTMAIELKAHHAKVTNYEFQTPSVSTNPLEMDDKNEIW